MLRLLPGLLLAYAVMALVWPWGVTEPLNPFRALQYFSRFFEKPWDELFDGALIKVTDMPRSYLPTLLALKLPEMFVVLAVGGVDRRADRRMSRRDVAPTGARCCCWSRSPPLLPIAMAVAMRPAMYNGIRHFLFVVPPLAVARRACRCMPVRWRAGAAHWRAMAAAGVFVVGIALPVIDMVRLHPYEYTSFNRLAGGVARRARPLHARLLGPVAEAGVAGRCARSIAELRREAAGPALEARRLRPPSLAAGRARPGFRDRPGTRRAPTSR